MCPPNCGGCCPRFSLEYLPSEASPDSAIERQVNFDMKMVTVKSDMQTENYTHFCKYLNPSNGRCLIHDVRPLSCDFELLRFKIFADPAHSNQFGSLFFGRGWSFRRVDGGRGAKCIPMYDACTVRKETARKLQRLLTWANYFGIRTKIPTIIDWVYSRSKSTII